MTETGKSQDILTVALLQMTGCGHNLDAARSKGEDFCRRAAAQGADIALFPEMWSAGYTSNLTGEGPGDLWLAPERWDDDHRERCRLEDLERAWSGLAIDRDHPFIDHFRNLARELDVAIAITYLERWEELPRNTVSLIDRHGEIVLTYAKVHTCDFDRHEASLTPGDAFRVATLDTRLGDVRVGAMICYDREFPESARVLMLEGAELILIPNACMLYPVHLAQLQTRAVENMLAVAMTNYAGTDPNGHSAAYHPVAFYQGKYRDPLVVEAGEAEGIYLAPFDLTEIREYRSRETWGNAFRKPSRYQTLVDERAEPPFVRINADGERYHETRAKRQN